MVACGVTPEMSPNCSESPSNGYRSAILSENGECKSSVTHIISSKSFHNLLDVNSMCSMFAQKDGNVYKRRKMDKDFVDENTIESTKGSCRNSEEHSSLVEDGNRRVPIVPPNASHSNSAANGMDFTRGYEKPVEVLNCDFGKNAESHSSANDRCSSSASSLSSLIKQEKKDAGECSSSRFNVTEPITELISARELCISVLKSDGVLDGSGEGTMLGFVDSLNKTEGKIFLSCKTCGSSEHPLKMIICDSCEAAFHPTCCYPRIKGPPPVEWFCLPCWRKKPKSLHGKTLNAKGESFERTNPRPQRGHSLIECMLKDTDPYVCAARIGKDFQAEVPAWSGPFTSDDGYFDEPSVLDPTELSKVNVWKRNDQNKPSIGNWIQCRELFDRGETEKPVVCGKWRRAPLFVTQTNDWDCSCSVVWDPIHADCAVPQELETEEVLKHLKYINMLKNRLVDRSKKPA